MVKKIAAICAALALALGMGTMAYADEEPEGNAPSLLLGGRDDKFNDPVHVPGGGSTGGRDSPIAVLSPYPYDFGVYSAQFEPAEQNKE